MIPVFSGKILNGKLALDLPSKFTSYLETLEGKYVEVTVKRARSQRSIKQNSYYWSVCVKLLSDHTGYEQSEMHEILKYQFLKKTNEAGFEFVQSTTKLSTTEFEEYLDSIKRWASMLGVVIPDPGDAE